MSEASRRREWLLPLLYLVALAAVRAGVLDERDPYWQVRAGVENLAGDPLARPDAWSWDPVEGLFTQTSPGWNDALAIGWRAVGFPGFFAVGFTSLLAYGLVVLALARRLGARPLPTLLGVLATLLLALPMLSPRATLVAQTLFLAGLLAAHKGLRHGGGTPLSAVLALVFGFGLAWLGSWAHLSWFLLAPAFAVALGVLLVASPWLPLGSRVVLGTSATLGLALGVLAGPYGLGAWSVSRAVQSATQGVILEWLPPWAPGLWPRWLPTALVAAGAAVAASVWVWRHWGDRRLDHRVGLVASLLVLAAPAAVGGFIAIRFIGISLLSLAPLAGLGATLLADRVRQRMSSVEGDTSFVRERMQFWSRGRPWRIVLSLVLVLVAPLALLAGARLGRPAAEADAAAQLPPGCRLFSDPSAAAPVLLLRPDVKVWFDSRADYWGRERNLEAIDTLASGDTSRRGVAGANCAMFSPDGTLGTSSMAAALGEDPSWRSTWSGGGITVWVRRP